MRNGGFSRTQPGMQRARGRKARNRALREEQLRGEAMQLGISVHQLKQEKFEKVQDIRRLDPLPEVASPYAYMGYRSRR